MQGGPISPSVLHPDHRNVTYEELVKAYGEQVGRQHPLTLTFIFIFWCSVSSPCYFIVIFLFIILPLPLNLLLVPHLCRRGR